MRKVIHVSFLGEPGGDMETRIIAKMKQYGGELTESGCSLTEIPERDLSFDFDGDHKDDKFREKFKNAADALASFTSGNRITAEFVSDDEDIEPEEIFAPWVIQDRCFSMLNQLDEPWERWMVLEALLASFGTEWQLPYIEEMVLETAKRAINLAKEIAQEEMLKESEVQGTA
jgi:hypothetical protein